MPYTPDGVGIQGQLILENLKLQNPAMSDQEKQRAQQNIQMLEAELNRQKSAQKTNQQICDFWKDTYEKEKSSYNKSIKQAACDKVENF